MVSAGFNLGHVQSFISFFVSFFDLNSLHFPFDVGTKVLSLSLFPLVAVLLNLSFDIHLLRLCEAAILAKRVEANHISHLLGFVGTWLDGVPGADVGHELLALGIHLFLKLALHHFKVLYFLLLNASLFLNLKHFRNSCVECLLKQTGLILQTHCHIRAEPRDAVEVNSGFAHDFGHYN